MACAELLVRVHTLALDQRIHCRSPAVTDRERRLHFDSPTRTRVNSDSCVNDGYCLRHFSEDTAPSTYFSPFPSRTLPRSTRTMTDSGQLRSSISLPGYHVDFFTFAEHVSFEHSTGSPWPVILFWKRRKHQQTDIQNSKVCDSIFARQPHRPAHACVQALRRRPVYYSRVTVRDLALAPRLFLATESTGTVLTPSQMSEIAGHATSNAMAEKKKPTGSLCHADNLFL